MRHPVDTRNTAGLQDPARRGRMPCAPTQRCETPSVSAPVPAAAGPTRASNTSRNSSDDAHDSLRHRRPSPVDRLGLAGGLVPGSDAGTKFDDGRADRSVVTGEAASRPAAGRSEAATTFGYPAARGNPAAARRSRSPSPLARGNPRSPRPRLRQFLTSRPSAREGCGLRGRFLPGGAPVPPIPWTDRRGAPRCPCAYPRTTPGSTPPTRP